jgi:hypothetical protein
MALIVIKPYEVDSLITPVLNEEIEAQGNLSKVTQLMGGTSTVKIQAVCMWSLCMLLTLCYTFSQSKQQKYTHLLLKLQKL